MPSSLMGLPVASSTATRPLLGRRQGALPANFSLEVDPPKCPIPLSIAYPAVVHYPANVTEPVPLMREWIDAGLEEIAKAVLETRPKRTRRFNQKWDQERKQATESDGDR